MPLTIEEINAMDFVQFKEAFGNVLEHCNLCTATIYGQRPYKSPREFYELFRDFATTKRPLEEREGILRLHPDLVGKVAKQASLTADSQKEHKAAQLNTLTEEEVVELENLNKRYKEKFGFPFVICARENKKEAIFQGLRNRSQNDKETEINTGVGEVAKIMYYRLVDAVVGLA